jgi:probable HAF family extracellular repeat protein
MARARAINDAGVVGGATNWDNTMRATVWDANGSATQLNVNPSGAYLNNVSSIVRGINANGDTVGDYAYANSAFRQVGGVTTLLNTTTNASNLARFVYDINDAGISVGAASGTGGTLAAYWAAGATQATALPGFLANGAAKSGDARAINENGTIVGWMGDETPFAQRAVRWDLVNGGYVMSELGVLNGQNVAEVSQRVLGVNDFGDVVGYSNYAGQTKHVLWRNGGQIIDLGAIAAAQGFSIATLTGINNDGWIVAGGKLSSGGEYQALLLRPVVVPEPSFYTALGLGLAGLLFLRRNRRA